MIFGIKEKCIILTHTVYSWLNIAELLMTAHVLQGHILMFNKHINLEQRFSEFHELMMESQKRKRM